MKAKVQNVCLIIGLLTGIQLVYMLIGFWGEMGCVSVSVAIQRMVNFGKVEFATITIMAYMWFCKYDKSLARCCWILILQGIGLWLMAGIMASQRLNMNGTYLLFLGQVVIIYVVLLEIFAYILGQIAARVFNSVFGTVFLCVCMYAFLTNLVPVIWSNFAGIDFLKNEKFFFLYDAFHINGGIHNIPDDYIYSMAVEFTQYERILMWIMLGNAVLILNKSICEKKMYGESIIYIIAASLLIIGYLQPFCSYIVYDNCPYDSWNRSETYALFHQVYDEKDEGVEIDYCELKLHLGKQLSAEAIVTLRQEEKCVYKFKLDSAYQVKNVMDQNGEELPFRRDNQTVTILAEGGMNISKLHFFYEGGDWFYIANKRAIMLKNAFYPQMCGGEKTINFKVSCDAKFDIYSNLVRMDGNCFEGRSEQLILFGGMGVEERVIDGVRVVYPSICYTTEEIQEEYWHAIHTAEASGINLLEKDWFCFPFRTLKYNQFEVREECFTGSLREIEAYCAAHSQGGRYEGQ